MTMMTPCSRDCKKKYSFVKNVVTIPQFGPYVLLAQNTDITMTMKQVEDGYVPKRSKTSAYYRISTSLHIIFKALKHTLVQLTNLHLRNYL